MWMRVYKPNLYVLEFMRQMCVFDLITWLKKIIRYRVMRQMVNKKLIIFLCRSISIIRSLHTHMLAHQNVFLSAHVTAHYRITNENLCVRSQLHWFSINFYGRLHVGRAIKLRFASFCDIKFHQPHNNNRKYKYNYKLFTCVMLCIGFCVIGLDKFNCFNVCVCDICC